MHAGVSYDKIKFKTCENPPRCFQRPYSTIWNASALIGTECHLKCFCIWEGRKENCVGHHVEIKRWDKKKGKLIYQVEILNHVFNFFITYTLQYLCIVVPYDNGKFAPINNVTKGQLMQIWIYNYKRIN